MGRLEFEMNFGRRGGRPRQEGDPMRILLLGDFSGKPVADRPPLGTRQTVRVDIDSVDDLLRRFGPRVTFSNGETMQFDEFEDFHPDHLVGQLARLRDLRDKRANPPMDEDDTLNRLLGKTADKPAAAPPRSGLDALIHEAVAPHIVKDTPMQAKVHTDMVDVEMGDAMRSVLHDPGFQAVEATWRGLQWVVSSLELDQNLQLHLFDVGRDELHADIVAAEGKVTATELHRALVDRWRNVPGEQGWSVIATTILFGPSDTDASLLAALGLLAKEASASLLAGAEWALAAGEQLPAAWTALRQSEVASAISVATPRVLLRLPYGARGEVISAFPFEEFRGEPEHEHLLWGSGALALTILIGRAFTARGWELDPGDERDLEDLPAYVFERDGEKQLQPCAEYFLTERDIQRTLDAGLIPIVSRRDRNSAVVVRFQSLAG